MTIMWCVVCTLLVITAWGAHSLLSGAGVEFTPWRWGGLAVWLLWTFFGVAVVWTFAAERQPRAAGVSALLFGAGSAALAAVLLLLARSLAAW